MCGITGIWHLNGSELSEQKLKRFNNSLSHRGPDGEGVRIFPDTKIGLGHRRLSVLDLSELGKQPMRYAQTPFHITYNGEVYNFIELREELKRAGFTFRSDTDTEVILAAWQNWGLEAFDRFNGMWAIAIYDERNRKLLLCRDRFGVKPLYYTFSKKELFAFASETHAFRYLEGFQLTADPAVMTRTIDNPVYTEGTGYTIWKDLRQLLPGHYLEIDAETSEVRQRRWFAIPQRTLNISYQEATAQFFSLAEAAVQLRLRSDVPVGTALSGGLDSSSVFAMIHHLKEKKAAAERTNYNNIKGFSATFENTPQDEREYTEALQRYNSAAVEYIPTDFNSLIPEIESSTRLFNDVSSAPISIAGNIYRKMREQNYIVSLDGHGADEMLYGYRSLVGMAITQSVYAMDESYESDLTATYLGMFAAEDVAEERIRMNRRKQELRHLFSLTTGSGKVKHRLKRMLAGIRPGNADFQLPEKAGNPYLRVSTLAELPAISKQRPSLAAYNLAERELAIDFYYRNIPYNMRDFDRAAMQHGVEIRMPFMDYRLVNFTFSLPMHFKVGHGFSKRVMRDAFRAILPEKIWKRRQKTGLGAPLSEWFSGPMKAYLLDVVHSQHFLDNDLWDGEAVKHSVVRNASEANWSKADAQHIWHILNTHLILT